MSTAVSESMCHDEDGMTHQCRDGHAATGARTKCTPTSISSKYTNFLPDVMWSNVKSHGSMNAKERPFWMWYRTR